MFEDLNPRHTRWIASFMTSIGLFLVLSMLYVASNNPATVVGIVFITFVAGILSGAVIATVGAILFLTAQPKGSDCD